MGAAKKTINHDAIRKWVEDRGGRPARVARDGESGELRIEFADEIAAGGVEALTWRRFFQAFEAEGLAFLYQQENEQGRQSRFNQFVRRTWPKRR